MYFSYSLYVRTSCLQHYFPFLISFFFKPKTMARLLIFDLLSASILEKLTTMIRKFVIALRQFELAYVQIKVFHYQQPLTRLKEWICWKRIFIPYVYLGCYRFLSSITNFPFCNSSFCLHALVFYFCTFLKRYWTSLPSYLRIFVYFLFIKHLNK